mgnify:CR=1 FL=1
MIIADDGAIDAYAGLLAPLGTGQGDIQTITVAPRARRQGLARTLMLQLLNEARRRGAEELFLEVRVDNPARRLYHRLGFRRTGPSFVNAWWRFESDRSRERVEEIDRAQAARF